MTKRQITKRVKKKNNICILCNNPCYGVKYCTPCYTKKAQLGRRPWNKDKKTGLIPKTAFKKGEHVSPETEFQKGQIPLNYKGDEVGYYALHQWVKRHLGKAIRCQFCLISKNIQWANKSFEYKRDLEDWLELCYQCHRAYDRENGWGKATEKYPYLAR